MTAAETPTAPRLWTPEGFRDDEWRHAEDAAALEEGDRVIMSLEAFLSLDSAARRAAAGRAGVELAPGDGLEDLAPYLDALDLIALAFPAFSDGRSYSKAALLRERYGYEGEIRATGQVLIDQIDHMRRCGFSTFEVSNPTALARLEADRPGGIPLHYQPSSARAGRSGGYAWRRVSG